MPMRTMMTALCEVCGFSQDVVEIRLPRPKQARGPATRHMVGNILGMDFNEPTTYEFVPQPGKAWRFGEVPLCSEACEQTYAAQEDKRHAEQNPPKPAKKEAPTREG